MPKDQISGDFCNLSEEATFQSMWIAWEATSANSLPIPG
jgi:hypothetical protein